MPARRKRGTGLRDTERVIVGGARSLSGWSRTVDTIGSGFAPIPIEVDDDDHEDDAPENIRAVVLEPLAAVEAPPVRRLRRAAPATDLDNDDDDADIDGESDGIDAVTDTDETEDGAPRRRRRGRRGGRGRRRPEAALDADAPSNDAADTDDADSEARVSSIAQSIDDHLDSDEMDDVHEIDVIHVSADNDDLDDDSAALDEPDEDDSPPPVRQPARRAPRTLAAVDPATLPQAFAELGVGERTLQALARYGFANPTPIQQQAIPALIAGRDVVGVAQTGSGKTIAFSVPMVEQLDPQLPEVQGLVLVPTRELASQVLDVLKDLASGFGLEAVGILGGHALAGDFKALERRPAIVVGTPGRVIDHLKRGTLSLHAVRYAVLDEADQMLDIGFLPDIRRILSRTPKRRQTALFSATMPSTIRRLIWQFMDDPETVTVDPELSTVDTIQQIFYEVASRDKAKGLRELVESELKGRTLVFCKMKRGVDRLEGDLARQGVRVGALHGDMDQRRRDRVVQEFRAGELDVLIATNVAARGLDIPEITHVVNYDVPQNPEEYVHRIGRTGRAGRDGKAITFVSEWDMREWDAIANAFGEHIERQELSLYS